MFIFHVIPAAARGDGRPAPLKELGRARGQLGSAYVSRVSDPFRLRWRRVVPTSRCRAAFTVPTSEVFRGIQGLNLTEVDLRQLWRVVDKDDAHRIKSHSVPTLRARVSNALWYLCAVWNAVLRHLILLSECEI